MKLEERVKYIGGSEAAGIMGLSRWQTPLSIWAVKTGQIVVEDEDSLPKKLGKRLEEVVAELFTEATGKRVNRVNETLFHPQFPYLAANIDRRVVGEDAGLECKTASAWKAREWEGEEIPHEYILQCYHYLAVTGKKRWYLAVLIGNQDFKWKVIERDETIIANLVKREVAFWNDFVLTETMPTTITKRDADTLDSLFPQAEEKEVELGDDANILIENLDAYKKDYKNLEGLIDLHENQLKALLGTAASGRTKLNKVYWVNSKTTRLDAKAIEKDLPDVHAKYYKSKPIRRFNYCALKENENGND